MDPRTLLILMCMAAVTVFADVREVSEQDASVFMKSLLASGDSGGSKGHPALIESLSEASRAGRLTFTLIKGDDGANGTPASAAWHGEILQDEKKAFGFRLRRNPKSSALEIYHFWTIGIPKGIKAIRGFLVYRKADPVGTDNDRAAPDRV